MDGSSAARGILPVAEQDGKARAAVVFTRRARGRFARCCGEAVQASVEAVQGHVATSVKMFGHRRGGATAAVLPLCATVASFFPPYFSSSGSEQTRGDGGIPLLEAAAAFSSGTRRHPSLLHLAVRRRRQGLGGAPPQTSVSWLWRRLGTGEGQTPRALGFHGGGGRGFCRAARGWRSRARSGHWRCSASVPRTCGEDPKAP